MFCLGYGATECGEEETYDLEGQGHSVISVEEDKQKQTEECVVQKFLILTRKQIFAPVLHPGLHKIVNCHRMRRGLPLHGK